MRKWVVPLSVEVWRGVTEGWVRVTGELRKGVATSEALNFGKVYRLVRVVDPNRKPHDGHRKRVRMVVVDGKLEVM